jgi:hypothetical protein
VDVLLAPVPAQTHLNPFVTASLHV